MARAKSERITVDVTIPEPLQLPRREKKYAVIGETMNRLRLAMSEIRVVKHEGKERIANQAALVRARLAYVHAAQAIGLVRQHLGLTEGPQRPDPPAIQVAHVKLEEYRRAIGKLDVMEVEQHGRASQVQES